MQLENTVDASQLCTSVLLTSGNGSINVTIPFTSEALNGIDQTQKMLFMCNNPLELRF